MLTRLANRSDFREIEKEWQYEWIFFILESLGIPEESLLECLPEDQDFSNIEVKHKILLRELVNHFDLNIQNDKDGGIKIYAYNNEEEKFVLIAEWKKCKFILREDRKQIDFNKRLYMEIQADPWSIFDEENE